MTAHAAHNQPANAPGSPVAHDASSPTTVPVAAPAAENSASHSVPQEYAFLDFRTKLLPHLLANLPSPDVLASIISGAKGNAKKAGGDGSSAAHKASQDDADKDKEEKDLAAAAIAMAALNPTDSQWYMLNQLRIHAGLPERSAAGIDKLIHYYAHLTYLDEKFPFETGKIEIEFTWYEAFDHNKLVIGNCIQYEKASTLFNLAAIYSQLGAKHRMWTADGKKTAAAYFQKAAGVLVHIRDTLTQRFKVKVDKCSDMSEETLTGAATLMLAQAAECFYEKANDEKSSSPVTALVAVYSADLYDVAYRSFKTGSTLIRHRVPRTWSSTVKAKALLFSAIAHFHTGPVTSSERVVGERIARLSVAQELVGEAYRHAQDVGGILREITKGYVDVIENACMMVEAANHNQLHETPYDLRLLSPLKRPPQALVHPSPVHEAIPNPGKYKDPFHPLLAPNHREDVRHVMEESRRVAHAGQTKLHACVKSIDEFTKKHGLSLPHPVGVAIPNPGLSAQNPDDLRAHAQQFLKRLHDLQGEEASFSSSDMLANFTGLLDLIGLSLQESTYLLEHIDLSRVPSDPNVMNVITAMRSVVSQHESEFRHARGKLNELKHLHDTEVKEFSSTKWTDDKLAALIPVLSASYTADEHRSHKLKAQYETAKAKRDVDLARVDEIRRTCQLKI
ncbi:BRO1-like domain-containing protein, partial [Entophlyctis helioformis]